MIENILHSHSLDLNLEITVFDKEGNIKDKKSYENKHKEDNKEDNIEIDIFNSDGSKDRHIEIPFRSFVKNWSLVLESLITQTSVVPTNSVGAPLSSAIYTPQTNAPYYNADYGILVGIGAVAFTPASNSLTTKILHGITTGTLSYDSVSNSLVAVDGASGGWKFSLRRLFTNSSSATITIAEIGLFAKQSSNYYMIAGDTKDATGTALSIPILNNQTFQVSYNFLTGFDNDTTLPNGGFLKQYLQAVQGIMRETPPTDPSFVCVDGTTNAISVTSAFWDCKSAIDIDTYGIVIGSDSTALLSSNSKLVAQILHSSTALNYLATTSEVTVVNGNDSYFAIKRNFSNLGSSNIIIKESGIYTAGNGTKRVCIARNTFADITLEPSNSIQIKYILKVTT